MVRTRLERLCDGWIEAGWLMALIAVPLILNIHSTRVLEPEKSTLVRAIALVMTVAWIVRWAGTGRAWRPLEGSGDRPRRLMLAGGLATMFFFAVNILASLCSVAPRVSWWGSYDRMQGTATTLAYVAICLLVAGTLRSERQWRRLIYAVTLTSLPVALYAIVQSLGHDPISWGTDFGQRAGSTLGNPVFLGGYLVPVVFLTAGELTTAWWKPGGRRHRLAAGMFFSLGLALQCTALLLSQSRGPIVGLLAGFFITSLLGLLVARKSAPAPGVGAWLRHAWLIPIGGALLAIVLLVVAARPDSPLAPWRELPHIGRVFSALDPEVPSTRFRGLVWGGVDQLWRSAPSIEFGAGGDDRLAAFRPLIGYGPETLRVTFPAVSSPELAHYERANVVPDRAHNEVFDVLATTGLLGLGAFFCLWGCMFVHVASALGFVVSKGSEAGVPGRDQARLWWALGGSVATCIAGVMALGKPMLLGLAVPAGLLLGFTGTSIAAAVRGPTRRMRTRDRATTIRVVALAGALVAHFVEIQTGIAVTATRLYFWIFWAALMVVAAIDLEGRSAPSRQAVAADRRWPWSDMLLAAAVLVTVSFAFVTNSQHAIDWLAVLAQDLAGRPVVVVLLAATWLFAVAAIWGRGRRLAAVICGALGSLAIGLVFIGFSSIVLADLARRQQTRPPGEVGSWIAAPYSTLLATLLLLLGALGCVLARPWRRGSGAEGGWRRIGALVAGLALAIVAGVIIERVCLRPIRADMLFKHGQAYFAQERFDECLEFYRCALEVDPKSDRLWLARGHLERIRAMRAPGEAERQTWFEQAGHSIDRAIDLHPLLIDHGVYRAQLYSAWGEMSRDPIAARGRLEHARRDFELAVARNPGSTGLRNLVADFYLRRGERRSAEALFRQSLALDPRTTATYLSLVRMRLEEAAAADRPATAEVSFRAALELYDRALDVVPLDFTLHAGRGYVLTQLGQLELAMAAYSQAVAIRPSDTTSHLGLAILFRQTGRPRQALEHAHSAYASRDESVQRQAAELIRDLAE